MIGRTTAAVGIESHREAIGSRIALRSWLVACAVAEAVGMTAAACAAKISQEWLGDPPAEGGKVAALTLVVIGGLVEGTALGTLQASVLRRSLTGFRTAVWVSVTIAVAGLGWAAASAPSVMSGNDGGAAPHLGVVVAGALGLGALMGAVLGLAQSAAFGVSVQHPRRWIAVSALGWAPAMVLIFIGAMTPASAWPLAGVAAIGAVTGLCAGSVLGVVTGLLMPRLGIANQTLGAAPRESSRIHRT